MCFYIYAPSSILQIEYASEFIRLDDDGCSEVIVDLLITSKSTTSIKELKFLYPNRFYEVKKNGKALLTGEWSDVTDTFLSDHEYNWVYNLPGSSTAKRPSKSPPFAVPKWGTYFEIAQPDPRDTTANIYYQGIIAGGINLEIVRDFDPLEAKTLSNCNFTLFKCSIKQPLEKDVPRWMRFKFRGKCSTLNKEKSCRKEFIKRSTNQLHYEYQIFGPYDVRDRLITYLAVAKRACDEKTSNDIRRGIIDLYSYFMKEGMIPNGDTSSISETKIIHWYIHVHPGKMGRITDVNITGDVQVAGLMPNYIGMDPNTRLTVYEWKTGFTETNGADFKFTVNFQAKPINLIYPLIPWVAFFLAFADKIAHFLKFLFSWV